MQRLKNKPENNEKEKIEEIQKQCSLLFDNETLHKMEKISENKKKPQKSIWCKNCHKEGHKANECTEPKVCNKLCFICYINFID